MTWEIAVVILGVIGGIVAAIIKFVPQKNASPVAGSDMLERVVKLEAQNESLRTEVRMLREELTRARDEIRRLSDAILRFLKETSNI